MLRQVGLLREALVAAVLCASEGALAGVYAEVVEEIMPFPEEHAARGVVALQNFDEAHRPRVFVLEDSELACRRHCLLNLDGAEVEVAALLDVDLGGARDLLLHLSVGDVVESNDNRTFVFFRNCAIILGNRLLNVV